MTDPGERTALPKQLLRRALLEEQAYQAETGAPGIIKLDAMESPHALPAALAEELGHTLARVPLHRYPDPQAAELKAALRTHLGLPHDRELLLGNGSDELIQLLCLAIADTKCGTLSPAPSFVMYRRLAPLAGLRHVEVALRPDDFSLDQEALHEALREQQPALLWIACPNNPTGLSYPVEQLRRLLDAAPGLTVIDEAYQAFNDNDCLELLSEYPDLLILRTFSKQGLAGLRLGLLLGAPRWLRELEKLRLPYNIGALNQAAACFLLRHWEVLEEQAKLLRLERARLASELGRMDGLRTWPSQANFLLLRSLHRSAGELHRALRQRGLLLKNLHGSHTLLHDCLRAGIGTKQENDCLLEALEQEI